MGPRGKGEWTGAVRRAAARKRRPGPAVTPPRSMRSTRALTDASTQARKHASTQALIDASTQARERVAPARSRRCLCSVRRSAEQAIDRFRRLPDSETVRMLADASDHISIPRTRPRRSLAGSQCSRARVGTCSRARVGTCSRAIITRVHILACISQKGGTGKTTLAVSIAVAAGTAGHTAVVIDLDPQGSASDWYEQRHADTPTVVACSAVRLVQVLDVAREGGAALAVLDTPPHSAAAALAAAERADFVIMPCRPGIYDVRAIRTSAEICQQARTPAAVVMTAVPPRGRLAEDAAEALRSVGLEVAPIRVGQRIAFVHTALTGQTVTEVQPQSQAAREIEALYHWTWRQMSANRG